MRLIIDKKENPASQLTWKDIINKLHLNIHPDTLRKATETMFGGYNVYKNINQGNTKKYIDYEKEKIKYRDIRNDSNRMIRESARIDLFLEEVEQSILKIPKLQLPSFDNALVFKQNDLTLLLAIADAHYGTEFEIKGLDGNILNAYSPEIFCDRLEKIKQATVDKCNLFGVDKLVVFDLGDCIDGLLHLSQLTSLRYGVIDSCIFYAEIISEFLNALSAYVKIDYFAANGNHSELRLLTGKKGDFPNENIQKIITYIVKLRLKDNNRIVVHDSVDGKIYTTIQGFNILGVHGDNKSAVETIKNYSVLYPQNIDYLIFGHKHHCNYESCGFTKGAIGVGSIMGTNDYAIGIQKASSPTASILLFEKDVGRAGEYIIHL